MFGYLLEPIEEIWLFSKKIGQILANENLKKHLILDFLFWFLAIWIASEKKAGMRPDPHDLGKNSRFMECTLIVK